MSPLFLPRDLEVQTPGLSAQHFSIWAALLNSHLKVGTPPGHRSFSWSFSDIRKMGGCPYWWTGIGAYSGPAQESGSLSNNIHILGIACVNNYFCEPVNTLRDFFPQHCHCAIWSTCSNKTAFAFYHWDCRGNM